jgi:hypothetical protein
VHISSTGKLTGNMETRGIVIEDGAILHSKVAVPHVAVVEPAEPQASLSEADQPPNPSSSEPLPNVKGATGSFS